MAEPELKLRIDSKIHLLFPTTAELPLNTTEMEGDFTETHLERKFHFFLTGRNLVHPDEYLILTVISTQMLSLLYKLAIPLHDST